jgi:hypothetical protein
MTEEIDAPKSDNNGSPPDNGDSLVPKPKHQENGNGDENGSNDRISPRPKEPRWLFYNTLATTAATIMIAIATAVAVCIAIQQRQELHNQWQELHNTDETLQRTDETLQRTLVASTRAWVSPSSAEINWQKGKFAVGERFYFIIHFGNVGKEPAQWFAADQRIKRFRNPGDNQSWFDTFTADKIEGLCKNTSPNEGGGVIYPSGLKDRKYEVSSDFIITKEIMQRMDILYIEGCFAYKTFNIEARSAYCFMLVPMRSDPKNWEFHFCLRGNEAS